MYVITKGEKPFDALMDGELTRNDPDTRAIAVGNQLAKQIMEEKDSGRPGHYYGRDIVIEGQMPASLFLMAAREFEDDPTWYTDDKKFQDFMARHPKWNWLKR